MPRRPVLLVGSLPYKTVREVFDITGPALAGYAARLPDGEAQGWNAFPAATLKNAKGLRPSGRTARMQPEMPAYDLYEIVPGIEPSQIAFAPVGYDKIAMNSYAVFKETRAAGKIAPGTRFQVSLPTPFATIGARCVPEQVPQLLPAFEQHFFREVDTIVANIPAEELAFQWDIAVEIIQSLLGNRKGLIEYAPMEFLAAALARASERIPENVQLGLHFCYGNPGGRHIIEPDDTGLMVNFANSILAVTRRNPTWIHMPVPHNRDDDDYFRPLCGLKLPESSEFYLGLVHLKDGLPGTRKRMEVAQKYAPYFGVGWECGLRAFAPETIPDMLELHRAAADLE